MADVNQGRTRMARAAKQNREWLEATFPGIRIGRFACRDTASGAISQHSAYCYGCYDSNALDIFPPLGLTVDEKREYLDRIAAALNARRYEWSIRLILWQVSDHYDHIHVDYWPTILVHKWCGRDITPTWRLSTGDVIQTKDPDPEHGDYDGGDDMFCPWQNQTDPNEAWFDSEPPCENHWSISGDVEWGVDTGICNVFPWFEATATWAITSGRYKPSDKFRDDFARVLTDDRYLTLEMRAEGV